MTMYFGVDGWLVFPGRGWVADEERGGRDEESTLEVGNWLCLTVNL